ncbi:MAG TPA: LysR family transcriptional regulator [Terriglobales bacterium]|nr:LysR family transcriptional regulator [Terriglobales bacterium]
MELMQLQMLVALAEERTLQTAAARVYRTPQAISTAIGKLTEEIGTPLLDRTQGRDLRLTPAGQALVSYARRLLSLRDEALATMQEIRNVRSGHLRIGANQSIGEYLLPELTEAFQARYPGIKLKLMIGYSDAVVSALKGHEIDIALVASKPRDEDLRAQLLMCDRLIAVVSPRHPLTGRDVIHIQELGGEPLIILTARSELRERVAAVFKRFCVPLNVQVETGTLESIKNMVARDMGVGIVPRMSIKREEARGELVAKTIAEFGEERSLWLVYRRTTTLAPACQAFIKVIQSELTHRTQGPDKAKAP